MNQETVIKLLKDQYNLEKTNQFTYRYFAYCFDTLGLFNVAKFFKQESDDELNHSEFVYNYMLDRQYPIDFGFNFIQPVQPTNIEEYFNLALDREVLTTQHLSLIYASAIDAGAPITVTWLKFLLDIQIEEEATYYDILKWFEVNKDNPSKYNDFDRWIKEL